MTPAIRSTTPSPLGDCLRAVAALAPRDTTMVRAIVSALGVRARTGVAPAAPIASTAAVDDEPDVPSAEGAVAAPPPRSVDDEADLPPVRDATLVPDGEHAQPAPDWLQRVALLPTSDRVANPFRGAVEPLFDPRWQRAIVTGLSAAWEPGGAIDLDRVIAKIATGAPFRSVPRRPIRSAHKGVLVLIDQGESMQPFRRDVAQLVRAFRRTIGVSRLRLHGFRGLPSWGVTEGPDWRPFEARADATPVVLVTDLGLPPQPDHAGPATPEDWLRFLDAQAAKGMRATVVVPRGAASLPAARSRHVSLVAWDRRTRVSRLATAREGRGASDDAVDGAVDGAAVVADLASACALAARIEPSLLRDLRLAVAPDAGVGLEAAVWFGPFVADRASTGIVLAREARESLLVRLRGRPALCAIARELVARAHEDAPAAVRLEEEATWRWAIGETERARDILRRMVATVVSPERGDAWRWAARAVERLPPALMAIDEGRMLALGTAVRSGDPAPLRSMRPATGRDWRWLRATTRETALAVTLRRGAIEFGPATAKSPTTMRVPDVNPLWIDIVPDGREDHAQRVRINPTRRVIVSIEGDRFELEAIGGERHRLEVVQKPAGSAQKFVVRNAAPRVEIAYQLEWYGALRSIELPFVVGVMAELSGSAASGTAPLADRRFVDIDIDNFDQRMKEIGPRVAFRVAAPDDLSVDLTFGSLADFAPAAMARRVPPLAALLDERGDLRDLLAYLDGRSEAEAIVEALLESGSLDDDATEASSTSGGATSLRGLHRALRPRTDAAWQRVVATLRSASSRLAGSPHLRGHDVHESLQNLVADLDRRLDAPVNDILHHPDFQRLESAWRGLFFLVSRTDTGEDLRIRVLDLPRRELVRTIRRHAGDQWDQSVLFRKIHEEAFGVLGGTPYGCLIADYAFDQRDVETLTGLARIAAASQAPLLAAAGPGLLQMDSWRQLAERRDLAAIFDTPEYAPWTSLRADEDCRWIGLTMPRFLARLPYGAAHDPVDEFAFEEEGGSAPDRCVWANAAYALGANITRAFRQYGWCARIRGFESGGAVTGLPTLRHWGYDGSAPFDSGVETPISDRRETELARSGLMPLIARRGGDGAYFLSTQTLMRPATYDDAGATANAALSGRLPFLLAIGRFAHYVKCIARDRIGSFFDVDSMERTLQAWLAQYVDPEPARSSKGAKAAKPLAQATIRVELVEDRPGAYRATLFLQPHYQLEGLTTSLRVVTLLFADPQASDAAASAS